MGKSLKLLYGNGGKIWCCKFNRINWGKSKQQHVFPFITTMALPIPFKAFLSWALLHRYPWHPRFCAKDPQCLPPFSGALKIVLCRDMIPVPHLASHSLHCPQSERTQSMTEIDREERDLVLTQYCMFIANKKLNWILNVETRFTVHHSIVTFLIFFLPFKGSLHTSSPLKCLENKIYTPNARKALTKMSHNEKPISWNIKYIFIQVV